MGPSSALGRVAAVVLAVAQVVGLVPTAKDREAEHWQRWRRRAS